MNKRFGKVLIGAILATIPSGIYAKQWTLKECINYALENNISLQKTQIKKASANEDYLQSKAALLPSLSASSNQNVSYTPWVTSGISGEGFTKSSVDKVYYNGSYSVMGNYVIWNGNKNRNQVKLNKLTYEAAALDSATQAQNLQEQIATLYIQICYSTEAIKVNQESYKSSLENENRGKEFVKNGKMSQADLAQLTAQRAQDEYNIVAAESNVKNYKRQLKELLQITNDEAFDIVIPSTTDSQALASIPALNSVYASALDNRPEIKSYQNMIDQSNLNIDIAKAGKMPTISANAGVSTSSTSMNKTGWGTQIKQNFNLGGGVSISIPIYDNRATKTAINKANLQKQSSMLDLKNEQTKLYSTIENYWLQANTNQSQFKSAKVSTESAKASFELLNEQFKLGLKNIVELRTGKDNLLKAQQNELQAKYLTILNLGMLNFYKNGKVE
ncbi:TolC family protein [Segatella hominis]|uniref:TolC family protein n=1 Tax=Segatella hominis TaxID=2518605 RepID=A0A4Y8VLL5_9BACT|nr:TolC family protein [Segatella hominis]TFH81268.1 TolC family protein [Segatella hominis]